MLEKFERLIMLYDFYGPLLTERQQQAIILHYENDLSLAEVAEEMGITRQGVFDLIKRAEKVLEAYEDRLGLVVRFADEQLRIKEAVDLLRQIDTKDSEEVQKAIDILEKVLEPDGSEGGIFDGCI
ncbi:MAG: YlxM family DNA-binding protein [Candidatus Saccharibacteria bacterium]